ncbi:MAG: transposase, partial [Veillonellales bacterium]
MARQARQKSGTGIYHVILRGINKQVIFEDEEDRQKFLAYLQHYKMICNYAIYGYCLMDNHIHLVLKEQEEDLSSIMKRIGVRYVAWYNRKYARCGHLFQDRFKSEVIESDEYLLSVLRYIHQNPLKAKLVKKIESFAYSSYTEYVETCRLIDRDFVLSLFSVEQERAREAFKAFMKGKINEAECMEAHDTVLLSDEDLKQLIQKQVHVKTPADLQAMKKEERDAYLRIIKRVNGVSTRQIARLT